MAQAEITPGPEPANLERFPIRWNRLIVKESLGFKVLGHVLIEKIGQLFRNMLSSMIFESGNWFPSRIMEYQSLRA
ncbi:MAG: hypothetical protein WBG11_06285 [Methylocella sp.]